MALIVRNVDRKGAATVTSRREVESRTQEVGIRTRAPLIKTIVGIALGATLLSAGRAAADPVTISGGLTGRHNVETLDITFPDFAVFLDGVTHLMPNFGDAGNGMPVPFTQSTGSFSGHSTGDMDVVGTLSFVGPTDTLIIGQDQGAAATLQEAVTLSGFLKVTQFGQVLFNGTFVGGGTGTVSFENRFFPSDTRLEEYTYTFVAAATPEPASILMLGTGVVWLAARRRVRRQVFRIIADSLGPERPDRSRLALVRDRLADDFPVVRPSSRERRQRVLLGRVR